MTQPRIRHIASQWSLAHYPSEAQPYSLEQQILAARDAGFDGFVCGANPEAARIAKDLGMLLLGGTSCGEPEKFRGILQSFFDTGVRVLNFQLADEDTSGDEALRQALRLMEDADAVGIRVGVEVHRDTCTETPEKAYALADGYQKATGKLLPMTWDCSHIAVVKHLAPPYAPRILVRPDLIQFSEQFHMRPFNGHHCQVPVTDGKGNLTPEVKHYLEFARAAFAMWIDGNRGTDRELFVVPEMGPVPGGYNLSTLPNSWEEAKVLRGLLDSEWQAALAEV